MLPAILLVGASGLFLGIRMLIQKNGKFPETEIGHNKEMRKRGIICAKSEEVKVRRQVDGKNYTNKCGSCRC